MAKELDHPQLSEIQVDLWLAMPVTKALLECFEWKRLDARDVAGSGELVDSASADLTHALLHRSLGQQDAYTMAQRPRDILTFYELIAIPDEEPDADADA